jgi:hypothetical protein
MSAAHAELAVAIPLLRTPGEMALLLPDGVPRQWYVDLAGAMADGQAEVIEASLGLPARLLAAAGYFDYPEGLCCNWEGAIAGSLIGRDPISGVGAVRET